MSLRFTWDPRKAASNLRKHGVGFPEAATAFADPLSLTIPEPDHSAGEEWFVRIGQSERRRLVAVVHVERGDLIRTSAPHLLPAVSGRPMKKKPARRRVGALPRPPCGQSTISRRGFAGSTGPA